MVVHHISHRIMDQEGEKEETTILEEEVEANSIMVEINNFHLKPLTISLLKIFPLKIPLKVLSMTDHLVKFVASLVIKLWIAIAG